MSRAVAGCLGGAAWLLAVASPLDAQSAVAEGRVLLPRVSDTLALPGIRVLLHRVARAAQGPLDSATTRAGGRFRFRFRADTSALFLLSARYGGIEYFSAPVHTNPARPDTAIRILAYDTSSTTPIAVEARHIVVPRPGADGGRAVLDLIVLRNDGLFARVAPDSAHPSWSMALPPGTGGMEVGESDLSPDAVLREGDTVKVVAPLAPGQKQLSLEYAVAPPRGRLEFAAGSGETPVNLLVEERDVRVSGGELVLADSQVIEGRSFRRWSGRVPAGGVITVAFGASTGPPPGRILALLVGAVGAALTFAAWRLMRRPPSGTVSESRDALLDAIAALDARYAGREAETPSDEWARYTTERAALKARLEGALAAAGGSRYV
ncbi:MAG TPA: hypothetical protein VMY76_06175 [Gemmatimonadales bacterium]|nr:hypothetical protein [Gemmatimonadales bacterium]